MGSRAVSPGGALLRSSRMFSIPKPLPEPQSPNISMSEHKSKTMTRQYPQHQAITSPLSSREKGDWGLKRPLPLKTTMATTTPVLRINQVDSPESITDFGSAADHALSLEKFQELRVPMAVPRNQDQLGRMETRSDTWAKSVFEEDMDFTTRENSRDEKRWKFSGPWLARMPQGDFVQYLNKTVRPRRAEFRALLRKKLAEDLTAKRNNEAAEKGEVAPGRVEIKDITQAQFTDYLRALRNDRVTLYSLVSKFLDLAPLGQPVGFAQTGIFLLGDKKGPPDSPYGKSGPPPSHPSAGISYLRTGSFMENHHIYGPQAKRSPALARIVFPRAGAVAAKLGVGGFVAPVPYGDNQFNVRTTRGRAAGNKPLAGIAHLDVSTFGGAKAYVEPFSATVDPSGKVVLKLRETSAEAQLIAKERKGEAQIYNDAPLKHTLRHQETTDNSRFTQVADEVIGEPAPARELEQDIVSSSQSYGLDTPERPH